MASYAAMTPLAPELEKLVQEPDWDALSPALKEHWRKIVRAALANE